MSGWGWSFGAPPPSQNINDFNAFLQQMQHQNQQQFQAQFGFGQHQQQHQPAQHNWQPFGQQNQYHQQHQHHQHHQHQQHHQHHQHQQQHQYLQQPVAPPAHEFSIGTWVRFRSGPRASTSSSFYTVSCSMLRNGRAGYDLRDEDGRIHRDIPETDLQLSGPPSRRLPLNEEVEVWMDWRCGWARARIVEVNYRQVCCVLRSCTCTGRLLFAYRLRLHDGRFFDLRDDTEARIRIYKPPPERRFKAGDAVLVWVNDQLRFESGDGARGKWRWGAVTGVNVRSSSRSDRLLAYTVELGRSVEEQTALEVLVGSDDDSAIRRWQYPSLQFREKDFVLKGIGQHAEPHFVLKCWPGNEFTETGEPSCYLMRRLSDGGTVVVGDEIEATLTKIREPRARFQQGDLVECLDTRGGRHAAARWVRGYVHGNNSAMCAESGFPYSIKILYSYYNDAVQLGADSVRECFRHGTGQLVKVRAGPQAGATGKILECRTSPPSLIFEGDNYVEEPRYTVELDFGEGMCMITEESDIEVFYRPQLRFGVGDAVEISEYSALAGGTVWKAGKVTECWTAERYPYRVERDGGGEGVFVRIESSIRKKVRFEVGDRVEFKHGSQSRTRYWPATVTEVHPQSALAGRAALYRLQPDVFPWELERPACLGAMLKPPLIFVSVYEDTDFDIRKVATVYSSSPRAGKAFSLAVDERWYGQFSATIVGITPTSLKNKTQVFLELEKQTEATKMYGRGGVDYAAPVVTASGEDIGVIYTYNGGFTSEKLNRFLCAEGLFANVRIRADVVTGAANKRQIPVVLNVFAKPCALRVGTVEINGVSVNLQELNEEDLESMPEELLRDVISPTFLDEKALQSQLQALAAADPAAIYKKEGIPKALLSRQEWERRFGGTGTKMPWWILGNAVSEEAESLLSNAQSEKLKKLLERVYKTTLKYDDMPEIQDVVHADAGPAAASSSSASRQALKLLGGKWELLKHQKKALWWLVDKETKRTAREEVTDAVLTESDVVKRISFFEMVWTARAGAGRAGKVLNAEEILSLEDQDFFGEGGEKGGAAVAACLGQGSFLGEKKPMVNFRNRLTGELLDKPPTLPRGGILGDEMGLGKTVSVAALIAYADGDFVRIRDGSANGALAKSVSEVGQPLRTLVVCPFNVLSVWTTTLSDTLPGVPINVYHGQKKIRPRDFEKTISAKSAAPKRPSPKAKAATRAAYAAALQQYERASTPRLHNSRSQITLTSYETFAKQAAVLAEDVACWHRVILDEAHDIRNAKSKASKAILTNLHAQIRWAVTGTPIVNRVADVFPLFSFLKLEPWNNTEIFKEIIQGPIEANKSEGLEKLNLLMRQILLRRTKDQQVALMPPPPPMGVELAAVLGTEKDDFDDDAPIICSSSDDESPSPRPRPASRKQDVVGEKDLGSWAVGKRPAIGDGFVGVFGAASSSGIGVAASSSSPKGNESDVAKANQTQDLIKLPPKRVQLIQVPLKKEHRELYDRLFSAIQDIVTTAAAEEEEEEPTAASSSSSINKNDSKIQKFTHIKNPLQVILKLRQLAQTPSMLPPDLLEKLRNHELTARDLGEAFVNYGRGGAVDSSMLGADGKNVVKSVLEIFYEQQDEECPICMEDFEDEDAAAGAGAAGAAGDKAKTAVLTSCGHLFHRGCLKSCLDDQPGVCPMCRCKEMHDGTGKLKLHVRPANFVEQYEEEKKANAAPASQPAGAGVDDPDQSSGKFLKIHEIVHERHPDKIAAEPVVIFSSFVSLLKKIRTFLLSKNILSESQIQMFSGEIRPQKRLEIVDAFQGGQVPVLLCSLKAAGVGITLTRGKTVVLVDPWWNLAMENQAIDRLHRIGFAHSHLDVFKLVGKDTIEQNILDMQASKQAVVEQATKTEGKFERVEKQRLIYSLFDRRAQAKKRSRPWLDGQGAKRQAPG